MDTILSQLPEKLKSLFEKKSLLGWELGYVKDTEQMQRDIFVAVLAELDEDYHRSLERQNTYYVKDRVQRTFETVFGTIMFKRYTYIHRVSGKPYKHIDALLNMRPYQRVSDQVCASVISTIVDEKLSYEKACRRFNLSKTFAYNRLKALHPEQVRLSLAEPIHCENLHVMADEDHVAVQDKSNPRKRDQRNSHHLRQITLYTGITQVSKHRNQLQNRAVFAQQQEESIVDFCQRVQNFIYENYQISGDTFVYGDGANWIKTLANELDTPFILDKFHVSQALTRLCGGKRTDTWHQLMEHLVKDEKKLFKQAVNGLYPEGLSNYKQQAFDYLLNNWRFYQHNHKLPGAAICCAEGINSHYFAARLSSRPMGFSIKNIHTLGSLLALQASQVEMTGFLSQHISDLLQPSEEPKKAVPSTNHRQARLNILGSKNVGTRQSIKNLISVKTRL